MDKKEISGKVKVNNASFNGTVGASCVNFKSNIVNNDNISACVAERGVAGFSPIVNVVKNGDDVTITITDYKGTTTATIPDMSDEVERIETLIPNTANPTNKLVDSAMLNSSVQTATSNFRGDWATYADIPSNVSLYPIDAAGIRTPSTNDYLVVVADEQQNGGTWRYKYVGLWSVDGKNGWQAEYQVNETPFTSAQLAAINSGITAELVEEIGQSASANIGLQLFDTIIKDRILTYEESQGLVLQGTYIYKEALAGSHYGYPDFYTKCLEEYNGATQTEIINGVTVKVNSNRHKFYNIADKAAIDEYFNTTGLAWFYGVDTENERIFSPRDKYFAVKGNVAVAGDGKTLGITDGVTNFGLQLSTASTTLAIDTQSYGTSVGSDAPARGGETGITYGVTTDPINSGIEGQLTPNEEKYLYICVGNTTNYEGITNVVDQGMDILEQVNQGIESRVKLDGSNAEFPYIVETYNNGTSWYRIWSDGWCEQGGTTLHSATAVTINLLKPYKTTDYTILTSVTTEKSSTGGNPLLELYPNKTTSSFYIHCSSNWTYCSWETKGYVQI